jgi:hypothetical protein
MAVTMKQVRAVLDPEEPDYASGAALGPEALPHLDALVNAGDQMLASKAAYLASLIADPRSADVVQKAARSANPAVRVAAAAAAPNLKAGGEEVLRGLAGDPDGGVRKVARTKLGDDALPPDDLGDAATARTAGGAADRVVFGLMPGEEAQGAGGAMPGASSARMPGEPQAGHGGLMPGERPGGPTRNDGEMPS